MLSQERLEDYQAQCNVLYHALYFEPGDYLLAQFRQNDISRNWPESGETTSRTQGLTLLAQALEQGDEVLLEALKQDFSQLFVVPATMVAIPWGSPYLHEKRLLCGPSTLALARFYQQHKILVETQHNEPVDHIGLMVSVVGELLGQLAKGDNPVTHEALRALLTEHLLPWSGRFCELMAEHAKTPYYQGIAALLTSVLAGLQQDLDIEPLSLQLFQ